MFDRQLYADFYRLHEKYQLITKEEEYESLALDLGALSQKYKDCEYAKKWIVLLTDEIESTSEIN